MNTLPTLFDVNASYGKGAMGAPEFATIADRIAHMDRLGIARAVVWNVESRQHHALASNDTLLDDIARTPGAADRIVPALAISPIMLYERDGVAQLRRQIEGPRARALRFTRCLTGLTLAQIAPVMERIRDLRPVLCLRHDESDARDIADLATAFPEVHVVLADIIWGRCLFAFDLMRRHKNVLMESSWLHTFDATELLVRHFGAERLVFGTGYRSHNGASIAALARAAISPEDREKIAHGNLDRLLGLPPAAPAAAPARRGRRLWPAFLTGEPLAVDVVDAHGHIGPSGGYVLEAQREADQIPLALRAMERIGVGTMVCSGLSALLSAPVAGNDQLEALLRPHAGRLAGYVAFNPHYAGELVAQLDRYFSGSVFVGFKLLCGYWGVTITDPRLAPMWEYAERRRLPVLAHTWNGPLDSPALLKDMVRKYPNVSFILGHSGGGDPGRREAEELAAANPNVYLEWCGSFCSTIRWEETLTRVDPSRILFGTDAMAHDIVWELGRLLSVDAPDEILTPILGANMRGILSRRRTSPAT